MTKQCLGGCGYQEPYGFVPEADCPVHDPEPESNWWQRLKCWLGYHAWINADFYDDEHIPYPRMVAARRCKDCRYQDVTKY